jgi:hypothetical protein
MGAQHKDPLPIEVHIMLEIVQHDGLVGDFEEVPLEPNNRFSIRDLANIDEAPPEPASLERLTPFSPSGLYLDAGL